MHPVIEVLQVGVDELYRRHDRISELRRRDRTAEEEEEVRLLYDRTMPLLRRTGAKDLLSLARLAEKTIGEYLAWFEDREEPFELRLRDR